MVEKIIRQLNKATGKTQSKMSFKSLVAIVLFGAIILVFALFGLTGKQNQMGIGAAGRVNNALISVSQLQSEVGRLERMYSGLFGASGGAAQQQFLQSQAIQNLISSELVSQEAEKNGILVTDSEVRDFIVKDIPVFQKDGRFQKDVYLQTLAANRLTPGEFEESLRKDRKNMRTRALMEMAAKPLVFEEKKIEELQTHKRNIQFVKIDKEAILKGFIPDAAELKAAVANPEFVKKAEDYYKNNKVDFTSQAQVHAQHILIKGTGDDSLKKIEGIKARAAKEDFTQLAKELSEDQGSKANGGDLGTFGKGKMVPEFETAAFSQPVGVIGNPVKSSFGYHLIKVIDRAEAKTPSFEEAKEQAVSKMMALEKYDGLIKQVEDSLVKASSADLEAALKNLAVKWEETGLFDLGADSIPKLNGMEVVQAAYEVSTKKPLLAHLAREGSAKYIIKLKEEKIEAPKEPVKLAEQVGRDRSMDVFMQWLNLSKASAKIEINSELMKGRGGGAPTGLPEDM